MKKLNFLLGMLLATLSVNASAGQVVVRKSSEPFDAFAVRDEVQRQHEWREALRFQQQLQILQALPLGCIPLASPYHHFSCQGLFYRPYPYQNRELFIQIDPPVTEVP
ncbi:hypothetical protein L2719_01070 [Shewanella schlegeliana]|uniref:DUF2547 family protein n=1 Tax=Shewanella schlegeliana TaxID=190308 RepID=A0ABS1SUZ8_9GAMM|nr:hypothetical protein [Shewanella schlegeliana]MBL4912376.1 hypothetical protein [Shewanella schlegeliana]MCL1108154.1 hypothetical protein [Shewanella schlegeliana]